MPSAKNVSVPEPQLAETFSQLESGRFADPFFVLGPHEIKGKQTVTAFVPGAVTVAAISDGKEFQLEKQPVT